jgi:hypothetical protein
VRCVIRGLLKSSRNLLIDKFVDFSLGVLPLFVFIVTIYEKLQPFCLPAFGHPRLAFRKGLEELRTLGRDFTLECIQRSSKKESPSKHQGTEFVIS